LDVLAGLVADRCDLAAIGAIAAAAPRRDAPGVALDRRPSEVRARIAVAAGPAFSFMYPDNLEALAAAGAELVPFDPCTDLALPDRCTGLVAGGGFPEVFAEQLAANEPLLADVRSRVDRGLAVWAECGGLLWLCDQLDGRAMAGVVPATASMSSRLSLGYRTATSTRSTPLGPAGTELRGHEFHYSTTDPAGTAFDLVGRHGRGTGGFATDRLVASYLHVHLANRPDLAESFVATCAPAPDRTCI
jgi:cobyrinic acid a,c-diamide synthase